MWYGRHTIVRFLQVSFIGIVLAVSAILLAGQRAGTRTRWVVPFSIFISLLSLATWIWVFTYLLSPWPVRPDWGVAVVSAWMDVFNILLWFVGAIAATVAFCRNGENADIYGSGIGAQPWYPSQGQVLATFLWLGMS